MPGAAHLKITLQGSWPASMTALSGDIWQFGWHGRPTADQGTLQELADNAWDGIEDLWTTAPVAFEGQTLNMVKVASIGADDKYTEEPGVHTGAAVADAGTWATTNLIPQGTVVVSFTAESIFRGSGRRGRCYLPAYNTGDAGVLSASAQNQVNTFMNALFVRFSTVPAATPIEPVNIDRSNGTLATITQVRCGRVVDTQRRRRNKLAENYISAPTIWA